MKKHFLNLLVIAAIFTGCSGPETKAIKAEVLINHLGYTPTDIKKVVIQIRSGKRPKSFDLIDQNDKKVFTGYFDGGGQVANWHTGKAYAGYFTEFQEPGTYYIEVDVQDTVVASGTFKIQQNLLKKATLPLLLEGLQSVHPAEKYEKWDANIPFHSDRQDSADVHGGWYDASGDYSKYLSHLCYTNFMPPQQTPMVVYNLHASAQYLSKDYQKLAKAYTAEAAYGADFLVRMQDPAGYFYTTVFDNWSKDPTARAICAYETQDGNRTPEYQAAFREGAGIAIAALARLAADSVSGEHKTSTYLQKAEKGFAHLLENNEKYCDDGKENIIDDYCALMAATELFNATGDNAYLKHARMRMLSLANRIRKDENYSGWFSANEDGSRPYFHAAEAGYPLVALHRYLDFEKVDSLRDQAVTTIQQHVDFTLSITQEVTNPFGYPRQYVKATDEPNKRAAFFIPHENESGYWYQGENARLASLAAAFNLCSTYMTDKQKKASKDFSQNQINWILGLNPYDMSMLDGVGRNNPEYLEPRDWNYPGGIANGLTAGVEDESDIAFLPQPQNEDPAQKWRWPEQWIPHAGWFMLAVSTSE